MTQNRNQVMSAKEIRDQVFAMIRQEVHAQDEKWGAARELPLSVWCQILSEEHVELAKAMLEYDFEDQPLQEVLIEASQVAAVAVQIMEYCVRRYEHG